MACSNPWKTLSSRTVYQNPWITVREDQVVRPDGNPGIYGVVSSRTATGVVARAPSGKLLLVGQYRYPTDRYSWEIPEGGGDPSEDPLLIIQRELREETGYEATVWRPLSPTAIYLSNCFSNEELYLFYADELTFVGDDPDPTEELVVREASFEECLAMVRSGEITDAPSIMGIMFAQEIFAR
jgi:8-oxo-dGTP pyrophosphatase MutT (NUDIX family)